MFGESNSVTVFDEPLTSIYFFTMNWLLTYSKLAAESKGQTAAVRNLPADYYTTDHKQHEEWC